MKQGCEQVIIQPQERPRQCVQTGWAPHTASSSQGPSASKGIWSVKPRAQVERVRANVALRRGEAVPRLRPQLGCSSPRCSVRNAFLRSVCRPSVHPVEPALAVEPTSYSAARSDRCAPPNLSHKAGWVAGAGRTKGPSHPIQTCIRANTKSASEMKRRRAAGNTKLLFGSTERLQLMLILISSRATWPLCRPPALCWTCAGNTETGKKRDKKRGRRASDNFTALVHFE